MMMIIKIAKSNIAIRKIECEILNIKRLMKKILNSESNAKKQKTKLDKINLVNCIKRREILCM